MRRDKAAKTQRLKTLKRHNAPKAARRRGSSAVGQETKVARLTRELKEAHEQQTATADVLKLISRSTFDLQAVFQTLIELAARLCRAEKAGFWRLTDGKFQSVAVRGFQQDYLDYVQAHPLKLDRSSIGGRAVLERAIVHIQDVLADPKFTRFEDQKLGDFRTALGVPLMREGIAIGAMFLSRSTIDPFTQQEIELVTTFADQAVIAIENVRLFDEVQARTRDLSESLERQTATSEVLQIISTSPEELKPVFEAMLENATRLCEAKFGILFRVKDGAAVPVATLGVPETFMELVQHRPLRPSQNAPIMRAARTKQIVHVLDLSKEQVYFERDPMVVVGVETVGIRTLLVVPMVKDDEFIGSITIFRQDVRPFTDKQIELVTNFAKQAVIAIENTRLLGELRQRTDDLTESLEQQTATSEVLRVISSSPGELESVFNSILDNAVRICGARFGNLALYENGTMRIAAMHNAPLEFEKLRRGNPIIPLDVSPLGAVVRTKQRLHVVDLIAEEPYARSALVTVAGARSMLAVPMLKDDELIGAINIYRQEVRPFTDKQIALLENFGAQAVIAIENARLLNELRESLQQQTATADVLKVISRSTFNLQVVLDTLVESAAMLCQADKARILRPSGKDASYYVQARTREPSTPEYDEHIRTLSFAPGRGSVVGRVLLEGKSVHIQDVLSDPEYTLGETARRGGYRTSLGVPLLREGSPIGLLLLHRAIVRPFTDKVIELAETFADQAVIAIENVRLFDEVQARTRELSESLERQTATSEVLKVISSSPGELEPVFQAILANATGICEAKFGVLFRYENDSFHAAAMLNAPQALVEFHRQRGSFQPPAGTPLDRLLKAGGAIYTADEAAESNPGAPARFGGARSLVTVPMRKENKLVGAIIIYRQEVRPFIDKQIELLTNFAAQAVIAIENARLLNELRKSLQQQTATSEVLKVISSTPGELDPVFNAMLSNATRICEAKFGILQLSEGDSFRAVALHDVPPAYAEWRLKSVLRPGPEHPLGRLARTKQTIHVADILAEPEDARGGLANSCWRENHTQRANAQRKPTDWCDQHISPGGFAIQRQTDRAG